MKKTFVMASILSGLFFSTLDARSNIGAGVLLGQPTGLSVRVDQSSSRSIDAAMAWRLGDGGYIFVHADYLFLKPKGLRLDNVNLDWYYGAGVAVGFSDPDIVLAARIPVGVSHKFNDPSLELFAELAPGIVLVPETTVEVFGGVGLRYWFN